MTDNFQLVRDKVLNFRDKNILDDFYVFHVIQRMKDLKELNVVKEGDSTGDSQRLIKTWYVDSFEYFDRKINIMKELAEQNHARVYMLPQVRSRLAINRVLLKKLIDCIDDTNLRYDHLIRTAVCGCHTSRAKRWIIDIDNWDTADGKFFKTKESFDEFAEAMFSDVKNWVSEIDEKNRDIVLKYNTRSGYGILTPPFDLQEHWNGSFFGPKIKEMLKKDGMMLVWENI